MGSKGKLVHNRCMQMPMIILFDYFYKQRWVYQIFILGHHRFENDTLYTINRPIKFLWQFEKVKKMEVQITWTKLKIIW